MEKNKLRLKGFWKLAVVCFLLLIAFSYAMFQGGFVSWFLFYSFLPFAVYALAIAAFPLSWFKGKRAFASRELASGEKLSVSVRLERSNWFPLFYLVVEDMADFGPAEGRRAAKKLYFPGFKRTLNFPYEIEHIPRGEHHFAGIRLKTGDLLGLIEKETILLLEDRILVHPTYEEMVYRPLENQFDQGAASSSERLQRDTAMSVGIREYQPGDRFSWINWKATAKRDQFMTKEFEQRQSHDVLVLMDCTPSTRFEAIVTFSASLIRAVLRKGAEAGLITVSGERTLLPIGGGETQLQNVFYHLAKIKDSAVLPFSQVIAGESFGGRKQETILMVTGRLDAQLIEKAGHLAGTASRITMFVVKNKGENVYSEELSLRAAGQARGMRVVFVHEGNFKEGYAEVSNG